MLDNLRELVTPEVISSVAGSTGESVSSVVKGLGAAIPAIATTAADRSDDHGFMTQLLSFASRTASDPDALNTHEVGGWLSSLFGPNLSAVIDSIASYAGIRPTSAASLLSVGAPLVLGYLGRLVRSTNLSATGLAERLRSEQSRFALALPAGFDLPGVRRTPLRVAPAPRTAPAARSWNVPMLILLGVLGLSGVMWWATQREQTRAGLDQAVSSVVGTSGTFERTLTRPLPGDINITIPAGGMEDRMWSYLSSPATGSITVPFDRVEFDFDSISLTPESHAQIDKVAAILRAYPNAHVTVTGYTDSQGDEGTTQALSQARAEAVAEALAESGVDPARVRAVGKGRGPKGRVTLDISATP
jgi:outer membrane protein OmpA-like peptidoglycan-associated protein